MYTFDQSIPFGFTWPKLPQEERKRGMTMEFARHFELKTERYHYTLITWPP